MRYASMYEQLPLDVAAHRQQHHIVAVAAQECNYKDARAARIRVSDSLNHATATLDADVPVPFETSK